MMGRWFVCILRFSPGTDDRKRGNTSAPLEGQAVHCRRHIEIPYHSNLARTPKSWTDCLEACCSTVMANPFQLCWTTDNNNKKSPHSHWTLNRNIKCTNAPVLLFQYWLIFILIFCCPVLNILTVRLWNMFMNLKQQSSVNPPQNGYKTNGTCAITM